MAWRTLVPQPLVASAVSTLLVAACSLVILAELGGATRFNKWNESPSSSRTAHSASKHTLGHNRPRETSHDAGPAIVSAKLSVNASVPRGELGGLLFGIFFEEINHAGDGGLYAEMVENRAFGEDLHEMPSNASMYHSLASVANGSQGMFIRHCSFEGYTTEIDNGDLDRSDSSFAFTTLPGHAAASNAVSLESFNYPGMYLAVDMKNMTLALEKNDGTEGFAARATFTKVPGLADPSDPSLLSFTWNNTLYMTQTPTCYGSCSGAHPGCHRVNFVASPQAQSATFRVMEANIAKGSHGWNVLGSAKISVTTSQPLNTALPKALHISCAAFDGDACGVVNYGYWGMNVEAKERYNLSLFASAVGGTKAPATVTATLAKTSDGTALGSCTLRLGQEGNWTRTQCVITASASCANAHLQLILEGELLVNVVSLMPADLPGGYPFRKDLFEKLQAIQPAFVRFPGGCYVEGDKLADAFRWKPSVGPIHQRPGHYNLWGYWSDDGLGFYEYMILCELLGADPVWVINNGISHTDEIATADIEPWVQDALDSLEFATGPATSYWGSVRASMGRTEPFSLSIMAIGNEDCGKPNYLGNYIKFYREIKIRYPTMRLIANCDLSTHNPPAKTDIYDYHIYTNSETFFAGVERFDTFDRNGPLVFNSEYAITQDAGTGNLRAAVAEAAWMTGLERNSDVVAMASYAPLFVNVNDRRWKVDAIVYNSSESYGTPSYWNQVLFSSSARMASYLAYFQLNMSTTEGQFAVRTHRHNGKPRRADDTAQMAASVTMSKVEPASGIQTVFVKVSNWGPDAQLDTTLEGLSGTILGATVCQLSGPDPDSENTLDNPMLVSVSNTTASFSDATVTFQAPQWSVSLLTVSVTNTLAT
eukprot:scpid43084/ scgid5079/ Alpha-L-arabinofuranosidase 1; Beta-D-xylosidase